MKTTDYPNTAAGWEQMANNAIRSGMAHMASVAYTLAAEKAGTAEEAARLLNLANSITIERKKANAK